MQNSLRLLPVAFLSAAIPLSAFASFWDVNSSTQNGAAIHYVESQGIVSGYPDGSFQPESLINRAEFTKIIVNTYFRPQNATSCSMGTVRFWDTVPGSWYSQFLCIALQRGLINGYPDGSFQPESPINFVEAAKIISIADSKGTVPQGYGDSWYLPYEQYLSNHHAIPLSLDGPDELITRGEMAQIIYMLRSGSSSSSSSSSIASLTIEKTVQETQITPGGLLHYTVTVRNVGTTTAWQTSFDDVVQPNLNIVAITGECSVGQQGDSLLPQIHCILGDLSPGQSRALPIVLTVKQNVACGSNASAVNNAFVRASNMTNALYAITVSTPITCTSSSSSSSSVSSSSSSSSFVSSQAISVLLQNMQFLPSTVTVKQGSTVTWTNRDSMSHTITKDNNDGPASGAISMNQSYSYTFSTVGTFSYHCAIHPSMHGSITVVP